MLKKIIGKSVVPKESRDTLDEMISLVRIAQAKYANFDQKQVDAVFRAAALASAGARISLAQMAVQETGMGVMEDKVIKNQFASEYIYNQYKDTHTCGTIESDAAAGFETIAEPIGIIAGIVPTTNPTSTAVFKGLLALKTRNGLIISPHPRAQNCTAEAVHIIMKAAVAAGAPENLIMCIPNPTMQMTQQLMAHRHINLILATGGMGMVKAAYSSGTPAIGVGAGNTPVIIDESADIKMAVSSIIMSKTFDNGIICASEQAVIVHEKVAAAVKTEFEKLSCIFVEGKDKDKLRKLVLQDGSINSAIIGQPAHKIAGLAGFDVKPNAKILIVQVDKVGREEPFSYEKLSPVLAFYKVKDFDSAIKMARELVAFGGAGHTSVLYADEAERQKIKVFSENMRTGRVLVNMPAAQGAIGDIYNFKLPPSLTLGCGSWGGNSVSENIGVKHLMNFKSVALRRENMLWYKVPERIYFKPGCTGLALAEFKDVKKRAFIVTDNTMEKLGHADTVIRALESSGIHNIQVFADITPDPTVGNIKQALDTINHFSPDLIVALGGGSPMDAAKMIWLMYENPDTKFEDIAMRFMDIRKRIAAIPVLGKKATFVAIPTTSGTGSEVTPFTVITDEKTGIKYPITDYEFTPDMAIVDPDFVSDMPPKLVAYSGMDTLTHAIEAYTSVFANNFSDGQALEAIRLVFKYLPDSYSKGKKNKAAREKMHYAATIAGMAFANAFLGVCHSMAHTLGGAFRIPHGLANAILLPYVIAYNATDNPTKQGLLPQYKYPFVKGRYAKIADFLHLDDKGDNRNKKVNLLMDKIVNLQRMLEIPTGLKDIGIAEDQFLSRLDELGQKAFDDQCTGGNARYPLIDEIKDIYIQAYYGRPCKKKRV